MTKPSNPITQALNLKAAGIFRLLVITTALLGGVIALGGASATMLQGLYSGWQLNRAHSLTVYLPPEADTKPLTESLPTLQGVTSVSTVSPQQIRSWIAPNTGSDTSPDSSGKLNTQNLPLPAVIEVAFTDTPDLATQMATAIAHIQQNFPMAEIDDHQPLLQQVSGAVRGLQYAAGGLALAMLALMALLITLTTRTGLQAQSATLHLLVQLGTTDSRLTRSICQQVLGRTLAGYTLGTAAAAVILMTASATMPALAAHLSLSVWATLILTPLLLPLLALTTAALTTRQLLHRLT